MRTKASAAVSERLVLNPTLSSIAVLLFASGGIAFVGGTFALGVLFWGAALCIGALALPVHTLPAVALACFALLPTSYLDLGYGRLTGTVTPAVIVIAMWIVRLIIIQYHDRATRFTVAVGVTSAIVLTLLSVNSGNVSASIYWSATVSLSLILPNVLHRRIEPIAVDALWRTWVWVALFLSLFAIVESLTHFNPLADLYAIDQKWSVYRVTTTLGHPLMNGVFFAVTALVLGFGAVKYRRRLMGVAALLAVIATALTGARGSVAAFAVGLFVWLVFTTVSARTSLTAKLVGVVFATLAGLLIFSNETLRVRLASDEAAGSAEYRGTYGVSEAWKLFDAQPYFGTGPGTSLYLITDATGFVLENAVVGTLVSLGVVGALVISLVVIDVAVRAIRCRSFEVVAGLTAFFVAGYGFPLWETRPSTFVLVTFLIILNGSPPAQAKPPFRGAPSQAASEPLGDSS